MTDNADRTIRQTYRSDGLNRPAFIEKGHIAYVRAGQAGTDGHFLTRMVVGHALLDHPQHRGAIRLPFGIAVTQDGLINVERAWRDVQRYFPEASLTITYIDTLTEPERVQALAEKHAAMVSEGSDALVAALAEAFGGLR